MRERERKRERKRRVRGMRKTGVSLAESVTEREKE